MQVAATPRHGLPEPGAPPVPEKTLSRWTQFLGSIAVGIPLADAMLKHYMTRADIEACVRSSPDERTRWDDARLASMKANWSALDLEDVFERIAGGEKIKDAVDAIKPGGYKAFIKLITRDNELNEAYARALKARAVTVSDEVLDIVDEDENDTLSGEKGEIPNNAAVNRSKLKAEMRMRLMGHWHPKLYGDQKNAVQVNVQVNHAERLASARARAKTHTVSRKPAAITQDVIDAAFKDYSEQDPSLAFLDEAAKEPALDTQWLET